MEVANSCEQYSPQCQSVFMTQHTFPFLMRLRPPPPKGRILSRDEWDSSLAHTQASVSSTLTPGTIMNYTAFIVLLLVCCCFSSFKYNSFLKNRVRDPSAYIVWCVWLRGTTFSIYGGYIEQETNRGISYTRSRMTGFFSL